MSEDIHAYYQEIAANYDSFYSTHPYIQMLHREEENLLLPILKLFQPEKILNLGCGTGRYMEYSQYGVDFSENMLAQAIAKYPSKDFIYAPAQDTGLPDTSFDLVIAMQLFKDVETEEMEEILGEIYRLLRPNGRLVFDIPSATRKEWMNAPVNGNVPWLGQSKYTIADIQELTTENWEFIDYQGILFLPLHRFPKSIISYFYKVDTFLCSTLAADYSTNMIITIQKDNWGD